MYVTVQDLTAQLQLLALLLNRNIVIANDFYLENINVDIIVLKQLYC